jgi:SAM-dependent methyltransferase
VLGFDLSPRMLERARHRAPSARFLLGSVFEVPLPRCQVICAVGEVLNYLADRTNDATALLAFFRRAFSALDEGGCLLFDAAEPGRSLSGGRSFAEGEGWAVGACSREEDAVLIRSITTFVEEEGRWRRDHEEHRLRLWPRETILDGLRQVGFEARTEDGYGGSRLPEHLAKFHARKHRE